MKHGLLPIIAKRVLATPHPNLERLRWFTGIDLGTTSSSAALVDARALLDGRTDDAVRLVPVRQATAAGAIDDPVLPSVVAEVAPGEWEVGRAAKEARRRGLGRGRQIFYSTKSEMGESGEPYYPLAPEDLNAPYKVAGHILLTLADAVEQEAGSDALASLVVTVPASFQLAARRDTVHAAEMFSIDLGERALLDEPSAALLDYLLTVVPRDTPHVDLQAPRAIVVFDFGGGTCDVSIVRARFDPTGSLSLANLAISRYERLGGDNIDAALAEKILLPELLRQNGLDRLDLTWANKRDYILPQLMHTAEILKLAVLRERRAVEHLPIVVAVPALLNAASAQLKTYLLDRPSLSPDQLDQVLAPFLDPDFLFPRGTELNPVLSIFAPVTDALERSGLQASEIDGVLLAGGSSLIPQVADALQTFFPRATLLRFPDAERTMSAVARGAALHSFFLHGLGRPLLKPIAQETIGLLTRADGFAPLIPAGTELPYPADGSFAAYDGLVVPQGLLSEVEIVVAADNAAKVLSVGRLPATIGGAGEPIAVSYRLDANKLLTVRAALAGDPSVACELVLENPLCSTAVASDNTRRIRELEQRTATTHRNPLGPLDQADAFEELGWLYYQERRYEQALDAARGAQRHVRRVSPSVFCLMAATYENLDQVPRAEACYAQVMERAPAYAPPWFNRSILRRVQNRLAEALEDADHALRLRPGYAPYHAQRALVLGSLGQRSQSEGEMTDAVDAFFRCPPETEFEKGWARIVARITHNARLIRGTLPTGPAPSYDASKLPAERSVVALRRAR